MRLLEELPLGVVVLDAQRRVVMFNAYEARVAGRASQDVVGRDFFTEVAPCMRVRELADPFDAGIAGATLNVDLRFEFPFPHVPKPREAVVRLRSFLHEGEPHGLVYIEDVGARLTLDRVQRRFAELVAHDMRSPLMIIGANLEFIESSSALEPDLAEAFEDARAASGRIEHMITDLLDLSALQSQTLPLDRRHFDLLVCAEEVVRPMRRLAARRDVELIVEPGEPVRVFADERIVQRALSNLVDNAIRHAPSGSAVSVRAVSEPDGAVLEVADRGPGVPEAMRATIFEPYVQLDGEKSTRGSRGLGLSFVRQALAAHGGRAVVTDVPEGGALFRLCFPA